MNKIEQSNLYAIKSLLKSGLNSMTKKARCDVSRTEQRGYRHTSTGNDSNFSCTKVLSLVNEATCSPHKVEAFD